MNFHIVYNSYEPEGRDYIGKRSTKNPYEGYLGSFSDTTFNPEHKIVLAYAKTPEGAIWLEMMFQRVFNVVENEQFANRSVQTSTKFQYDPTGTIRSTETRARMSKPKTEQHRKNISEGRKGIHLTKEHKQNIAKSRQGVKLSPEHCEAIRAGNTCKIKSPETCQKLSESHKGRNDWTKGRRWYHNSQGETKMFHEDPGSGWEPGRKPNTFHKQNHEH